MRVLALACLLLPGCYLSHERAMVDGSPAERDAAVPVADAGMPDANLPTGVFTFCGSIPSGSDVYAFAGCCTTGGFTHGRLTGPDAVARETLIKGSTHTVWYYGRDGLRHVFPMTHVLASWFHNPSSPSFWEDESFVCPMVVEVPDAELSSIPLGVSVTFRPGSVVTGIDSSPRRYVVTRGAVLRSFRDDFFVGRGNTWPPTRIDYVHLLPDAFFGTYTVGPLLTDPAEYDPMRESDTTLSDELARRAP